MRESCSHAVFSSLTTIMPVVISDNGQGMLSLYTLLITDLNDSATQDDKSPPPCMQLQVGVGLFLRPTHPLACNCETGWGFFILFFRSMNNDDDNNEPCRLVDDICVCLHPQQQRQNPTPLHATASR